MSKKNEIKLINSCILKNKKIKRLKNKINELECNIIDLIEAFQILQKILDFEFAFGVDSTVYMISKNLCLINNRDYLKLKNAIERYGIK